MELTANEKKFLSLLKTGEENATTGKELGAFYSAEDSFIRELSHSLKIKDVIIGSCPRGYFIPANDEEARRVGRRERARIAKQIAAVRVFDKYENDRLGKGGH